MLLMLPEILPMIIPQEVETLPRLFERSKRVETIPLPARTNLLEENKQEDKPEAAIAKSRRQSIPYMKVHELLKMTSPAKVKTTSPRRRTNSSKESPSSPSLKRLKPLKLANIAPRTNPNRQKPGNPPCKVKNFEQLLSRWEEISTMTFDPSSGK